MKLARDTWLTFQYEAGQLVRSPVSIAISLLQPITFLLLLTPFLKPVMDAPTYGDAYRIYVPSLFCAMGLFSGLFAGFALIAAIQQGVIARFRVTSSSGYSQRVGQFQKTGCVCWAIHKGGKPSGTPKNDVVKTRCRS